MLFKGVDHVILNELICELTKYIDIFNCILFTYVILTPHTYDIIDFFFITLNMLVIITVI